MHTCKAVLVTGQPNLLGFDDDRDCCVQPVAVAQVVAHSYRLHSGALAQVAAGNYHQQLGGRLWLLLIRAGKFGKLGPMIVLKKLSSSAQFPK